MTLADTLLHDPDAKEVISSLQSAFRIVGKRGIAARIVPTQTLLKRVTTSLTAQSEGVENWPSRKQIEEEGFAGQVVLAWWTAVSGKRYARVIGRVVTEETQYLLSAMKLSTRPPAWHVFPDRMYRRRAGKANDLIAVCGCGAVGTEKALGWAGPCCGPCADYRDEHGALPWKRPAFLPLPGECLAVAGSSDGRWVAGARRGEVRVWDLDAGAEPVHAFTGETDAPLAPQLALSRDGRFLATVGAVYDGERVLDLHATPPRRRVELPNVQTATLHPTRDVECSLINGRLFCADLQTSTARPCPVSGENTGPLVFSRDGSRLAVRRGQTICVCQSDGTELSSLAFPRSNVYGVPHYRNANVAPRVAFSPDGGQIAVGYDRALAVHHTVTGEQRFWDGHLDAEVTGLAYSPGGEWLYVGRRDGSLVALRTDAFSDERSVVLRWSLGPIRALAPCGDALLTACDEGVQVWPMAKLLEGL
jgi:hypothetical protein